MKEEVVDMNQIVGSHDILFVCLDTLRYDVAKEEEEKGNTPILNSYGNEWQKCHAPGNFTYPSHFAMFSGFLPTPADPKLFAKKERLFAPKSIGMRTIPPKEAFIFEGSNFIEGLAKVGYQTYCIGGVAFFNKRSEIGRVLPSMFEHSYWRASFACTVKESLDHQIAFISRKLQEVAKTERIMMYLNIDTIHYPNYFYLDGAKEDSKASHAAALRYVDERIEKLFELFRQRGKTFVIVCSDHGTCYGEDGYYSHRLSHEITYTVPYKHFVI